ncbi:MAG: PIN domain-containing protein [Thermodesulfovibrionia bacterium]|nr:PIN domain-containing protein [Thermodesulfovibrionia bacterium]
MGNNRKLRIFLDTSALIAGIVSSKGAAREILRLAEADIIDVVISKQVIVEADRNIASKLTHMLADYRKYMKALSPELVHDPSAQDIQKYARLINKDDAPILTAAELSGSDYLVTWDKKHFISANVKKGVTVQIVTPGEFLKEFREYLERL